MKNKPGLMRRDGTYYVRMRVPALAVEALQRREIKISLHTKDPKEAALRYGGALRQIHDEIASVAPVDLPAPPQKTIPTGRLQRLALEWISPRWRAAEAELWKPHTSFDTDGCPIRLLYEEQKALRSNDEAVYGGFLTVAKELLVAAGHSEADAGSVEALGGLLRRGEIAVVEASLRHYNGDTSHELRDRIFSALNDYEGSQLVQPGGPPSPPPQADLPSAITLNQAIERFLGDPQRARLSATNAAGYATGFKLLREVSGGELPLSKISRDHSLAVQRLLSQIPANATKLFPNLTAEAAAAEAAARRLAPLGEKTASNILSRLAAFFRWAVNQEFISRPRFHDLKPLQERKTKADSRRAFAPAELARLFSSALYSKPCEAAGGPQPSRYWIPLLALYQGCRLNELCQLETADVCIVDDVPCLHLSEEGVTGRTKRLKTHNAERTIPLHPILIRLGFLAYCEQMRAARNVQLFNDLTVSANGSLSDNFSKWFGRYCTKQGVPDARVNFHSFRHGFADACRNADIPQSIYARLGGWSVAPSMSEHYGGGYALQRMAEELAKVRFPSVEELLPSLQGVNDEPEDTNENNA